MRTLCELIIIAGLIYLGWEQSFSDRLNEYRGIPKPAVTRVQPRYVIPAQPAVAATPSGAWMYDSSHHSPLDTPGPHGTSGSILDPNHRSPLDVGSHSPHP